MPTQVTATEAKARLLKLLDEVETGEQIEITRRGKTIARLVPARGPQALRGIMQGIAWTTDPNDELFSTDLEWNLDGDTDP